MMHYQIKIIRRGEQGGMEVLDLSEDLDALVMDLRLLLGRAEVVQVHHEKGGSELSRRDTDHPPAPRTALMVDGGEVLGIIITPVSVELADVLNTKKEAKRAKDG